MARRNGATPLGPQSYATLQLIQVVGERNVRIVPDVSVSTARAVTAWWPHCSDR
jgi:hypothetical protein